MLGSAIEFQVDEVLHQETNVVEVTGRCCFGVISTGDIFTGVYKCQPKRNPLFDKDKFQVLIQVNKIEYASRVVDKLGTGYTGVLELEIISEGELSIEPNSMLIQTEREQK